MAVGHDLKLEVKEYSTSGCHKILTCVKNSFRLDIPFGPFGLIYSFFEPIIISWSVVKVIMHSF